MNIINFKRLYISLAIGLAVAVILSMLRFSSACDSLRSNCLRLHILANSNSAEDQRLKLMVRDKILELSDEVFGNAKNLEQAKQSAANNMGLFEREARAVCEQNGKDYSVKAFLGKEYFETRYYENFTLPAGEYEAVRLLIGEAGGQNWWCVMFPSVCIGSAAEQKLAEAAGKQSADIATGGSKYKIRFKLVELFEDIKHRISSKK